MTVMSTTAENLVRIGSNIEITKDAGYMSTTVEKIIRIAATRGCHVTVHAGSYMSTTLEQFARIGGKNVTIRI